MPVIYKPKGRAGEYAGLACNLYNGCTHGCRYCYAPAVLRQDMGAFHAKTEPKAGVLKRIEKEAKKLAAAGCREPILLCFTTDPYQDFGPGQDVTGDAIEILTGYGLPVHVLTKGGSRAVVDFPNLALVPGSAYACTLTFDNERDSLAWEPGAAKPASRISALASAKAFGLQTWASIEPVIDPEQSLNLIMMTAAYVDLYKVGKWNHAQESKRIDWPKFYSDAVRLLEGLGKQYIIKRDLQEAAQAGEAE